MRRSVVAVLLASLAVAGCRSVERPEAGAPTDRSGAGEELALVDLGLPRRLDLAMVEPPSMRPDEVGLADQGAVILADLLYDGLTEAQGTDGVLRPGLARSWSADDGFRSWTFRLDPAKGVRAATVAASMAPLVVGSDDERPRGRSMAALTAGMQSIEAVDDSTVLITLAEPNAGLPWIVSGLPFAVVGEAGAPTGDYEVASRHAGGVTLRVRNPAGVDDPGLPEIDATWVDSPEEAFRLVADRAVDAAVVGPASLESAEAALGAEVITTAAVRYYVLNPQSPDLSERATRSSLLRTIDRASLVEALENAGLATADGLVSPSMAGYRAGACDSGCAAEASAGSGPGGGTGQGSSDPPPSPSPSWPADFSLLLSFAGDDQQAMAEALTAQLDEVGVDAGWEQATARELALAIVSGTTDLFSFGWVAPAGSVDAVLPPLLGPDSPANVARITSPAVGDLLRRAALIGDDHDRWAVLDQAHRAAMIEAKILPVTVSTSRLVLAPGLVGVSVRADGSLDVESPVESTD